MVQCFEYFYAEKSLASNMHRAFTRSQEQIIIRACMIIIEKLYREVVCFDSADRLFHSFAPL